MKKLPAALLFLLLVFVVAAIAACVANLFCANMRPSPQDAHEWIHRQLQLTPEQEAGLDAIEKRYREKRHELERNLALANRELAGAIRSDGQASDRVRNAIAKIHSEMGELQMLTIGHVFEMKSVLDPGQYNKLLDFTADALDHLDSPHGGE